MQYIICIPTLDSHDEYPGFFNINTLHICIYISVCGFVYRDGVCREGGCPSGTVQQSDTFFNYAACQTGFKCCTGTREYCALAYFHHLGVVICEKYSVLEISFAS